MAQRPMVARAVHPSRCYSPCRLCFRGVRGGSVAILASSSVESLLNLLEEALLPLELRPLGQQTIKAWEQKADILLVNHCG